MPKYAPQSIEYEYDDEPGQGYEEIYEDEDGFVAEDGDDPIDDRSASPELRRKAPLKRHAESIEISDEDVAVAFDRSIRTPAPSVRYEAGKRPRGAVPVPEPPGRVFVPPGKSGRSRPGQLPTRAGVGVGTPKRRASDIIRTDSAPLRRKANPSNPLDGYEDVSPRDVGSSRPQPLDLVEVELDDTVHADDRNPHGVPPATPKSMCKQWCYTLNNPSRQADVWLRRIGLDPLQRVVYHVFQREISKTGTLHCQGFICFNTRTRMQTVKALLGGNPHLEVTRGTPNQAADYCKRPEKRHPRHRDFLHEFGVLPVESNGQGQRTDLAAVQAALDGGATSRQLATNDFPTWLRYHKSLDRYRRDFCQKPRSDKSLIFVFTGATGVGKSAAAYAFKQAFPVPPGSSNSTWFDGYDPDEHLTVIFDEMHGGRCSFTELLRITDEYPMAVNTKGDHLQFKPEAIVFTSNHAVREWYKTESVPDMAPFMRRIDFHWEYYAYPVLEDVGMRPILAAAEACLAEMNPAPPAERVCKFVGLTKCLKGDPEFHPHFSRYMPFVVKTGTTPETVTFDQWYGVVQQAPKAARARPQLWE